MQILGIDFGGSGVKGAPVETDSGQLLAERIRIETPSPSTPAAIAEVVAEIANGFSWRESIGCTVPAPVHGGVVMSAANIDKSWKGVDGAALFQRATGCELSLWNDADAAGYAEMKFGAGLGRSGVVIIVTLGTGIGTALFSHGRLVPNLELGHMEIDGRDAEYLAAARVRKLKDLSWKAYAKNLDRYLRRLVETVYPNMIIIGGGISKKADRFLPHITVDIPVVPAELRNDAGIIGAALAHAAGNI